MTRLLLVLVLTACATVPPKSPAEIARDARRASVAACNAYDAAVHAGLTQPDDRADFACSATRGICETPDAAPGVAP